MDFPLAQIWSLSRSQRSPTISCINNWICKLWLRSTNLYFAQQIFIWRTEFVTGFSFCIEFLINQTDIYSPKGGSVKLFLGTFLLCCIFLHLSDALWHKTKFRNGFSFCTSLKLVKISNVTKDQLRKWFANKKLWLRSANLYFAQQIFIRSNGIRYWIFLLQGMLN